MIYARMDLSQLQALVAQHSGPGLDKRLRLGLEEAGALVEARARAGTPVGFSQQLRGSHYHRPTSTSGVPGVEVGASAPYAIVVHDGRRPERRPPPPGALVPWMQFKGIPLGDPPRAGVGPRGGKPRPYWSVELLLALKIGREGTKGRPWLMEAFERSKNSIIAVVGGRLLR